MDGLVRKELAEGFISKVSEKPTCIHALGAVPKGTDSIRPITDCSRPIGEAVNNHCGTLVRKFSYNSIRDVVDHIIPNCFLSVIDIQVSLSSSPHLSSRQRIPRISLGVIISIQSHALSLISLRMFLKLLLSTI